MSETVKTYEQLLATINRKIYDFKNLTFFGE